MEIWENIRIFKRFFCMFLGEMFFGGESSLPYLCVPIIIRNFAFKLLYLKYDRYNYFSK